ncbi:MAG: adenylate/guanylate cyclase domain-containing protein [Symploca sp. SIO2C1]|nr:adenylate/guanylate cyclase domain-containing protein [Symploca sp. SIO2C1]
MFKNVSKRFNVKSKLMIILVGVSLGSILIVSFLSWERSRTNLREAIRNQLTSIRFARANQIESFFENLKSHVETLSEDRMVIEAMIEFNREFDQLNNPDTFTNEQPDNQDVLTEQPNNQESPQEWNNALKEYYTKEFFPRLSKAVSGELNPGSYIPQSKAAKYLQYHYIAKNSNPVGEKDKLLNAKDGSGYSRVHAKYQDIFRHVIEKFGYYDLFLIDFATGDIVYSVYKETDYGTSLNVGPYQHSNLAELTELVKKNPERRTVQIVDFAFYRPSYGAPAAFLGAPIYEGSNIVGILAAQLPVDELDKIMTANGEWKEVGLGESGETYLVGSDLLMRSNSRFLIEDPKEYLKVLSKSTTPEENIPKIKEFETSILLQKVDTVASRAALRTKEGTGIIQDYRGVSVLSSYTPLKIKGLDWVLLSEIDLAEAYKPVTALKVYIFILTTIVVVVVTWIASAVASGFLKPFNQLIGGLRQVGQGELDVELKRESDDEFGEAKEKFNETVDRMRQLSESLEQKNRENDALLLNILPASVVERLKEGEPHIANNVKLATVMFARIEGLDKIKERDVKQIATLLSELISAFDRAAVAHEVGKIKTNGDLYIAACGVAKPRLDSTKRVMAFAIDMFSILQRFDNEYKTELRISMGIDDGPVTAAVLGTEMFSYDVWGETVSIADFLQLNAVPGTILVTEEVYERLEGLYDFEPGPDIELPEINQTLTTWLLSNPTPSLLNSYHSDREAPVTKDTANNSGVQAPIKS